MEVPFTKYHTRAVYDIKMCLMRGTPLHGVVGAVLCYYNAGVR